MRKKHHILALIISLLAGLMLWVALFLYAVDRPKASVAKANISTIKPLADLPEAPENAQFLELKIAHQLLQRQNDSLLQLKAAKPMAVVPSKNVDNDKDKKIIQQQASQLDSLKKSDAKKITELNQQLAEAKKAQQETQQQMQALAQSKKSKKQLALEQKEAELQAKKTKNQSKKDEKNNKSPKLLAEIPQKLLKSKCKTSGEVQLNVTFDSKGRFISASRCGGSKESCLVEQAKSLAQKQLKTETSQRSHTLKYSVKLH